MIYRVEIVGRSGWPFSRAFSSAGGARSHVLVPLRQQSPRGDPHLKNAIFRNSARHWRKRTRRLHGRRPPGRRRRTSSRRQEGVREGPGAVW